MENDLKKDTQKLEIGKLIFYISLIYYIGWICYAIWCFFFGSSWEFISSLGSHKVKYGLDAIENVFSEFILTTVIMFPFIPIYQLVYIIYRTIYKIRKKK